MNLFEKNVWNIFRIFLIIRILSVYLVQTFYEADEYWQSLEVSHKSVYGYGYLTWEWQKGIRSYVHPLIFSCVYKVLNMFGVDSPSFIIFAPRLFQAVLSAYSDLCFYIWCSERKWAIFTLATSWFSFYMGSRTLINSFEAAVSTIALSSFPWPGMNKAEKLNFIWLIGFICIIRPTAAVMWLPLCFYHLTFSKHSWSFLIFTKYLPIGVILLMICTMIDSIAHGSLVLTSYEFLKFNVLQSGASAYGVLPWYWYMSLGIPAVLGVHLMPFIIATFLVIKYRSIHVNELVMLGTIVFTVAVFSMLPHKEFRFLMPLLPLILYITSRYLSVWSRKAKSMQVWIVAGVLLIGNIIPALYLGMVHQRGTLDVMPHLREMAEKDPVHTSFLFLMPCHSTPMYSHLHVNVSTRFLSCSPNFENKDNYVDEVTQFYENPNTWLRQHYPPNGTLPSHIITFNNLAPRISDILSRYSPILDIFHTDVPVSSRIGSRVLVYELQF